MKICWIEFPESKGRLGVLPKESVEEGFLDEVHELSVEGVDLVVSLLSVGEVDDLELLREDLALKAEGVKFRWFPIADWGVPRDDLHVDEILTPIEEALDQGKDVVLHCHFGIGRSPTVAALALVRKGVPATLAIDRISTARERRVLDTPVQRDWISSYEARITSLRREQT